MKRRTIRPAEGFPWERPGFKFYTDEMRAWLGGYEPTGMRPASTYDAGAQHHTASMRAGELGDIDRGRGSLGELRARTAAEIGHNDAIKRGGL